MSESVIVIGGGPAGIAAARAVSALGADSILIEQRDTLGGTPISARYAALTPNFDDAETAIGAMIDDLASCEGCEVRTSTTVMALSGRPGAFTVTLDSGASTRAR